jgi:hypothetical protein
MFDEILNVDEETKAADEAAVELVRSDVEALWAAQVASIQAEVDTLVDSQKGKYLAPIARQLIGLELKPEGLSEYGEEYFWRVLRESRVAALKPLYP